LLTFGGHPKYGVCTMDPMLRESMRPRALGFRMSSSGSPGIIGLGARRQPGGIPCAGFFGRLVSGMTLPVRASSVQEGMRRTE